MQILLQQTASVFQPVATKRVISSMQSFTKKISGGKGKDSVEIFPSSEH